MDRSWVLGRLFSREYISGVKNFMSFIQRKFSEDDEILCPCSRCLNQKSWHQGLVEKHLLVNGMESTYTRWIHHGENFDVDVVENPNDHHVENLVSYMYLQPYVPPLHCANGLLSVEI